ncbi:MAG TPA: plastocyanin/azurin family copper-binding protein [Phycisphaerae bacterium]|jgi:plastocyanin
MRHAIASALIALSACGAAARAANHNVSIANLTFTPQFLTIDLGDTVSWTNNDGTLHTATSGTNYTPDGVFDSDLLLPGDSYTFQFTSPGEFPYFCSYHTVFMQFGNNYSITVAGSVPATIISANPPRAADNPYAPGQPFRDVLHTGTSTLLTQGIGAAGTPAQGGIMYDHIEVVFSATPSPLPAPDNVSVSCTGGACPTVTSVTPSAPAAAFSITLSGAIPPLHCTTLTFAGTAPGEKLQYQYLPGDVNLDGSVSTQDLLSLVQRVNSPGSDNANLPENLARCNINRSTESGNRVNTQDFLREVQLLNGTNTTQVFNGAMVAGCPG